MSDPAQSPISVIGSINTDMVVKAQILPSPGQTVTGGKFFMSAGGKGGNQAVAAARLGSKVSIVANLGSDIFGDAAIERLKAEGINCDFVSRDENQPSGVALISVDKKGENHIVVAPGANWTLASSQIDNAFQAIENSSIILMQLEIPPAIVAKVIVLAASKNCRVILDPAPARELSDTVIAGAYLLTPNESEAESLTGIVVSNENSARQAARQLVNRGAKNVAITLGGQGVLLANAGGESLITTPKVDAVDTTAAGDCFNGSLAAALAAGSSLEDSIAFACCAASISVTRLGAQDSMPYAQEVGSWR